MTDLCRLIFWTLVDLMRARATLEAEIWVLRQQINVLRRAAPRRQSFGIFDRLIFVGLCRLFRKGMDLTTGYRHDNSKPYVMSERKWMVRFVFLESVAGVPGMCAGMLRHLRSLRRMNRDNGW